MPGVPSSRSCEACRKVRKKCDQRQPSCSRCSRLKLVCVGCGTQRFKFIHEHSAAITTPSVSGRFQKSLAPKKILTNPSNELATMTSAFISVLEVRDIRYDIRVYGEILSEIPCRLGNSAALDASVEAISSCYSSLYSKNKPVKAIENYMQGLKALRLSLNNPIESRSANTLCAFYLMKICHTWMAQSDDNIKDHGKALMHLINMSINASWQSTFDRKLLTALSVHLVMQSLRDPKFIFNQEILEMCEDKDQLESRVSHISQIPNYLHRPTADFAEIQFAHDRLRTHLFQMQDYLSSISLQQLTSDRKMQQTTTSASEHHDSASDEKEEKYTVHLVSRFFAPNSSETLDARVRVLYGLVLAFALITNALLRSFQHVDSDGSLLQESIVFINDAISISQDALQYRPLGSDFMPTLLAVAWAITTDPASRIRIEQLLEVYQSDSLLVNWMEAAAVIETSINTKRGRS